jgi:homoserine kinase type II
VNHAARLLGRVVPQALCRLEPWEFVPVTVQICVRDLRGEHVLFHDRRVSGIVDFGAIALDSPAVDLARLLGDYTEEREELLAVGVRAYRAAGGEIDTLDGFVEVLAATGAIGSAINWLRRLQKGEPIEVNYPTVEARLGRLLGRIERSAQT